VAHCRFLCAAALWFLDRMEPGRPDYNISLAVRIRGSLESRSCSALWTRWWLVTKLSTLRIVEAAGAPVTEIFPPLPAALEVFDLAAVANAGS